MASKLFRAVVGIGISLGTSSVACLGALDPTNADDAPAAAIPTAPPPLGKPGDPPPKTTTDGGADARADVAIDAPKDVLLDAFCDAAWPTTKGNPGGPTCGPVEECREAGPAPRCVEMADPATGTCKPSSKPSPAWCVTSAWQCSGGFVSVDECKCWTGSPCPPP